MTPSAAWPRAERVSRPADGRAGRLRFASDGQTRGGGAPVRLIRWLRSAWADAGKSGKWMADAFPRASGFGRWSIRTAPRTDMIAALMFLGVPILMGIFFVVALLIFLVVLVMNALT
jgi:hypothetical protein